VDSDAGQGTIGVVFGFQSAKVFYIVMWKKAPLNDGLVVKVCARLIIKILFFFFYHEVALVLYLIFPFCL
jgi:hypothetical protein